MAGEGLQNEVGARSESPLTSQLIVTQVTEYAPVLLNNPAAHSPG